MASLTQTSIITRKIIRYGLYIVVFVIIARFSIIFGVKIFRFFFPPPPPPPTVTFGKLPLIPIPEETQNTENLSFILETADGELPEFTDQLPIYFMPKATSTLQDLDNAKKMVSSIGFNPEGREIVETVFRFPHKSAPSFLTMNIVNGIFSLSYDLRSNPSVIEKNPPTPDSAKKQVRALLARAGLLEDDLSGPVTHQFMKISEGNFIETVSLSEASLIKVNLFRKNFNDLPAATLDPKEANVWFILTGSSGGNSIIAAEYHYFPIDEGQTSTYPIITSQNAWDDLKEGGGKIASMGENDGNIVIRNVYLAYFDSGQYMEFYQPVVVFEGDNNFVAYVAAITSEYYGE